MEFLKDRREWACSIISGQAQHFLLRPASGMHHIKAHVMSKNISAKTFSIGQPWECFHPGHNLWRWLEDFQCHDEIKATIFLTTSAHYRLVSIIMRLSKQEVNNNETDSLKTQTDRRFRLAWAINRVFHFVFGYVSLVDCFITPMRL